MWVILFTAKLLILLIVRLGRPSQKGVKKKKKKKINCLDKRALWAKGQVLKHPPPPPSAWCALRITTKRCAFKQMGCALGLM